MKRALRCPFVVAGLILAAALLFIAALIVVDLMTPMCVTDTECERWYGGQVE